MFLQNFLPIQQAARPKPTKKAQTLSFDNQTALAKVFKSLALAAGFNGIPTSLNSRSTFEMPDYDFERISQAIDTDSYARQGMNKYKELFWKEGWEIVGENKEAVSYLQDRINYMEIAMRRPFQDFLREAADQYVRYANVFIVKARGDLNQFFPRNLRGASDRNPIVGYYLIPTEQVEIMRDKNNIPKWYRQRRNNVNLFSSTGDTLSPKWNARDVIHLAIDKKPGRAFGTPFLASTMDDIIALRQIEEDIQNLYHRELFPLYKYMVGNDEHPASQEEVDKAAMELESLRTEGGLVLPHRHDVEVIGAQGSALDFSSGLEHMKERVAVGLGLFPHHLGMMGSGANRSMTDRLDTALYDKVKMFQKEFADGIRLFILNELLVEGGFNPLDNPADVSISDRCVFRFKEIDVDTQIKKETHTIQKVVQGIETIAEGRLEMGLEPEMDEADTIAARTARLAPNAVTTPSKPAGSPGPPPQPKVIDTTPPAAQKALPPGMPKAAKGPNNMMRPQNQFGTKTSPNVRRSAPPDESWLNEVIDLLDDKDDIIDENMKGL